MCQYDERAWVVAACKRFAFVAGGEHGFAAGGIIEAFRLNLGQIAG
jgi:hypothetical protein